MNVEDTGPIIDPTDGLRIAVAKNEETARLSGRAHTQWLRDRLQARCEELLAQWAQDEEAEE